ncbi:unnamed protein product [Schistosoma margrebowiei]|uniref:Uncharacterized protein n=1 Tax=Schistosoma margrebowiei TaxID=48269 RepID=A0A183MJN6_9TREM|nr:unnamed protein product [Schistosoma margrebowiei]
MILYHVFLLIFLTFARGDTMTDFVSPSKCEGWTLIWSKVLNMKHRWSLLCFTLSLIRELRLYEVLEDPPICNRLLQYKVHKERQDSSRFDKGTPQTMKNRGVDVKLDVPFELWDKPPAEVTALFKECIPLVNEYQDIIEEWFYNNQDVNLYDYLCRENVLDKSSQG